jgi:hypothetical protein
LVESFWVNARFDDDRPSAVVEFDDGADWQCSNGADEQAEALLVGVRTDERRPQGLGRGTTQIRMAKRIDELACLVNDPGNQQRSPIPHRFHLRRVIEPRRAESRHHARQRLAAAPPHRQAQRSQSFWQLLVARALAALGHVPKQAREGHVGKKLTTRGQLLGGNEREQSGMHRPSRPIAMGSGQR